MKYTRETDRQDINKYARDRHETKVTCYRQALNKNEGEIDMPCKRKIETET